MGAPKGGKGKGKGKGKGIHRFDNSKNVLLFDPYPTQISKRKLLKQ